MFCEYPENDVDEIIPGVWLGNYRSSVDNNFLRKHNIRFIVRVMPEEDVNKLVNQQMHNHDKIKTKFGYIYMDNNRRIFYVLPLKDFHACQRDLNSMFDDVSDFMDLALRSNIGGILVHCKRGHHRSAVVVVAFLMKHFKIDYEKSMSGINELRNCALRRNTCMVQGLPKYYEHLSKQN